MVFGNETRALMEDGNETQSFMCGIWISKILSDLWMVLIVGCGLEFLLLGVDAGRISELSRPYKCKRWLAVVAAAEKAVKVLARREIADYPS